MKVGSYSIPEMRLFPKLHGWLKQLYEAYRLEEIVNEDAAAQLCGHKSPNSGAWKYKKADFRLYGLMEPRALQLTSLAEALTYGTDEEKERAITDAILKVPLWKELHSRFGSDPPESNFWVQLQKITGLDPLDAQKHAENVRRAYLGDINHLPKTQEPVMAPDNTPAMTPTRTPSAGGWSINIQVGPYNQTIPYTIEGVEYAKGFLELLKSQIKVDSNDEEE
ncbi:MAG: hypothetical protein NWE89_12825 [Candidatus Bathyarchaeota archaeon]|nr:hypothetical protein [Candidatus Bathyarchaeota archaeon]